MNRQEELESITKNLDKDTKILIKPLIEQVLFVEEKLNYLQTLPFIVVHPTDLRKQKPTIAYKQYKDLSQTYLNSLKLLNSVLGIEEESEDSPLRAYFKAKLEKQEAYDESIS